MLKNRGDVFFCYSLYIFLAPINQLLISLVYTKAAQEKAKRPHSVTERTEQEKQGCSSLSLVSIFSATPLLSFFL